MPISLSQDQKERLVRLEHGDAFVWLMEVDIPTDPVTTFRFVKNPTPITHGTFSDSTPKVYSPFPFQIDSIESDTGGSLFSVRIGIANVTREISAALEFYGGLIGSEIRFFLVNTKELNSSLVYTSGSGEILSVGVTDRVVTVEIGQLNLQGKEFPNQRLLRFACNHEYGGVFCQYDTTRSGAMQTCSKFFEGSNGCEAHGLDEAAASLPNNHPRFFGGFLGLVRDLGL